MSDEFLFSERFNNICIQGSSRNFLNRNKNSKLIAYFDAKKEKFNIKDIKTNCLSVYNSSGESIIIEAPNIITEDHKFILPPDSGNSNEFLKTDGSGSLSWNSAGAFPNGFNNNIQRKNGTNLLGVNNFSYNGTSLILNDLDFTGNIISTSNNENIILSPNNNGIVEFTSLLKIQGGNPGVGKVLTSDVTGLSTWETPSAGGNVIETKLTSIDDNKSLTDNNKQSIYPIELDDDYTITLPSYSTGLTYKFLLTNTSDISSNPFNTSPLLEHISPSPELIQNTAYFGWSVSTYENFTVIGAYKYNSMKGTTLVTKNNGGWGDRKILTASDGANDDNFGHSVSINGNYIVVGAIGDTYSGKTKAGSAYIFEKDLGGTENWGERKKLIPSDASSWKQFGWSVSISGNIAVVGRQNGSAYVFEKDLGGVNNWGERKILTSSDTSWYFGWSSCVNGDIIVVGAYGTWNMSSQEGVAYIYYKNEGGTDNWGQKKKLRPSNIDNEDFFGTSVSINGNILIVGSPGQYSGSSNKGAIYLYYKDYDPLNPSTPLTDNWGEFKQIDSPYANDPGFSSNDRFGTSVSIYNNDIIVGHKHHGTENLAHIYSKDYNSSTPNTPLVDNWGKVVSLSNISGPNYFGTSVAINTYAIVGAYKDDTIGTDNGYAYSFSRKSGILQISLHNDDITNNKYINS